MRYLLLFVTLWSCVSAAASRMVVLDVGEGQAVLLQEGRHGVLVDTGHPGQAAHVLDRLRTLGVEKLDYLILTHLHPDHAGGYFRLRESFPQTTVFWNGQPLPRKSRSDMVRWVHQALRTDDRAAVIRAGDAFQWRGWRIDVLWPELFVSQDLNQHSLVLLLKKGDTEWLVMGDAGIPVEQELLRHGRLPREVDLLVVGHHGAADATSQPFLRQVRPKRAVISVNAGNIRGYPDEKVVRRLERAGADVLRTDLDGEVIVDRNPSAVLPQ